MCRPAAISETNCTVIGIGMTPMPVVAVGEDLALDEGHHDVHEPVLRLAHPHDVAHVRMRETNAERGLAAQARHRVLVLGEIRRENLDRIALVRARRRARDTRTTCRPRRPSSRSHSARRAPGRRGSRGSRPSSSRSRACSAAATSGAAHRVERHQPTAVLRAELRVVGVDRAAGRAARAHGFFTCTPCSGPRLWRDTALRRHGQKGRQRPRHPVRDNSPRRCWPSAARRRAPA